MTPGNTIRSPFGPRPPGQSCSDPSACTISPKHGSTEARKHGSTEARLAVAAAAVAVAAAAAPAAAPLARPHARRGQRLPGADVPAGVQQEVPGRGEGPGGPARA